MSESIELVYRFMSKQNDSEDEFESADEGESTNEKSSHSRPVTDGWDSWNLDDEPAIDKKPVKSVNRDLIQQDSTSSLSSSASKTGESLSHNGSDDDDRNDSSSEQQKLQRKKQLRKKPFESNQSKEEVKVNTRISRRDDESSSTTIAAKHNVKDAHHVLDRLSAQSPTRTVTKKTTIDSIFPFAICTCFL